MSKPILSRETRKRGSIGNTNKATQKNKSNQILVKIRLKRKVFKWLLEPL